MRTLAGSNALIVSTEKRHLSVKINTSADRHYVYILCRPDAPGPALVPFYVGKGSTFDRFAKHEEKARQNPIKKSHTTNLIRFFQKTGQQIIYVIDSFHAEAAPAFAREKQLIALYGRQDMHKGGLLTNHDSGGQHGGEWSEITRQRHLATLGGTVGGDDRSILNRFYAKFDNALSKPLKPLREWEANVRRTEPARAAREVHRRSCASMACLAQAHGLLLNVGVRLPRRFVYDDVPGILETGASNDLLKAGIAELEPGHKDGYEVYRLTKTGLLGILAEIPERKLTAEGVYLREEADKDLYKLILRGLS